jgi:sensor domain CHASE-containing protein
VELQCLFTLNQSGAFIWSLLDQPRTTEQIAAALASEFEVSEEAARQDVQRIISHLVGEGCVSEIGEEGRAP